jgi:hypothetical protein
LTGVSTCSDSYSQKLPSRDETDRADRNPATGTRIVGLASRGRVTGAVTIKPAPVPGIISSAAEIAQMVRLARLFQRRSGRDAPQVHDFGGAIGRLPMIRSPELLRLNVFADGRIELGERPVGLEDLEAELKSAYRPGAVVFYSRENPGEVSQVGVEVIKCVWTLGLPLAFPPEATPALDRILQDRGSAE